MTTRKRLDLSDHLTVEDCPSCLRPVWRALAVEHDARAYWVLIDTNGSPIRAYEVPADEPDALGWPRYRPHMDAASVSLASDGVLWAHGCFVPAVAHP